MKTRIPSIPSMLAFLVGLLAVLACRFHLEMATSAGYLLSAVGAWQYQKSPLFLRYLESQWRQLEEVEPMSFPEIHAEDFSQELFWKLSRDMTYPVVIRGALANSTAVNFWNEEFFTDHYAQTKVLAKEMNGETTFRMVRVSMQDFWQAFNNGVNVSIVASSSLFVKHPELLEQAYAPFEESMRDQSGHEIALNQLFVTPGGRTFHHCEFGANVFRQISGQKRWVSMAPEATKYLCPYFIAGSALVKPCVQDFEPELRDAWFHRLPRMETILNPGDVLYNPPWGWHDVMSVGTNTTQASVAGRIINVGTSFYLAPMRSFGVMLNNIKSRIQGTHQDYPKENFAEAVEDIVVEAWTQKCLASGDSNCFGLTHPEPVTE